MRNKESYVQEGIDEFLSGKMYVSIPSQEDLIHRNWREQAKFKGYKAAKDTTEKAGLHNSNYKSLLQLSFNLQKNCLVNERVFTPSFIEQMSQKSLFNASKIH